MSDNAISRGKRMVALCLGARSSLGKVVDSENENGGYCTENSVDDSISDPNYSDLSDAHGDFQSSDADDTVPENSSKQVQEVEDVVGALLPEPVTKRRRKDNTKRKNLTQEEKSSRDNSKHPLRKPCSGKCKKNCGLFTEGERHLIWEQYWALDYTSRRKWLAKTVQILSVNRRTVAATTTFKKNESRVFFLPKDNKTEKVCRLFFLNTLGYSNDSVITELCSAIKKAPICAAVKENRGTHSKPKCNRSVIIEHIESYNPCASHYRRHNAPNIRYLPRELTVKDMYNNFNEKNPGVCKIEIYRRTMKSLHISLCMPKSDTCADCLGFKLQETDAKNLNNELVVTAIADQRNAHKLKAKKATEKYKEDSRLLPEHDRQRIYSMDLQKVILLPIMPAVRDSYFTSRLVVFNETFASLKKDARTKNYCSMCHEAVAGREGRHIVDAIVRVIEEERDIKEFIFWADNCTAQNKNWILFTAFVVLVNESNDGPESIIIRYLTKGHTHMTADSIHGNIEKRISKIGTVYDYADLKAAVLSSRKNVHVLEVTSFHKWEKKKRQIRKQLDDPLKDVTLNSIVEVKFSKGFKTMKYKIDFDDNYIELDFLQKKFNFKKRPELISSNRGLLKQKKDKIMEVLVPLMPGNRREFWKNIPENDNTKDLIMDDDIDDINPDL